MELQVREISETGLRAALATIDATLRADGYELRVTERLPSTLELSIAAGPDACEDCLVPKAIMRSIIESTLSGAGIATSIELRYPGDAAVF